MVFNILVQTQELGIWYLSQKRTDRLELILKLHNLNYTNRQISDYFNERNIRSIRNVEYTPKLILILLKKYKEKLSGYGTKEYIQIKEELYSIEDGI